MDYFLARTDGGVSNKIPFLLYPLIPMPVAVAQGNTRSAAALRVVTGQADRAAASSSCTPPSPRRQITVLGGMLERPPQALVTSRTHLHLGGGTSTADLEDPVDTPVPLSARWRGLSASIDAPSGPRHRREPVDAGERLSERLADRHRDRAVRRRGLRGDEPAGTRSDRPAMLFPGDAWAELEEELPDYERRAGFTFYMVAVLHPATTTTSTTGTRTATRTGLLHDAVHRPGHRPSRPTPSRWR